MILLSVNPSAIGEPTKPSPNGSRCHSSAYMTVRRQPGRLIDYAQRKTIRIGQS
ncbi:hypothetical protein BN8_02690 [Fibrisoma limi BUZ 3]|uniref:Uncharacterized protein n=1 Tax=Fibrisoma limi BUZ 3 TaxID=1185876 RepID=I2GI58_9BACT|nr:hypothetical protein [Fibrisoma limi]CCH53583.1 hypothetical protein BN8_02690 [Fibrisoma limi BUZ 3]